MKHRRIWEALALLLLVSWLMAMAQIRCDASAPLTDLGFDIIRPLREVVWQSTSAMTSIADIFATVSLGLFILILGPFCTIRPRVLFISFFWCLAWLYAMRTLALLATVYPEPPLPSDPNVPYVAPNTALGAVLIVFGYRGTASDLMFSGHATLWVLTAMLFWQHRKTGDEYTLLALVFWALNITGMVLLIGTRMHWTADVLIGIFLTTLTCTLYYVVAHGKRRDSWAHAVIQWCES